MQCNSLPIVMIHTFHVYIMTRKSLPKFHNTRFLYTLTHKVSLPLFFYCTAKKKTNYYNSFLCIFFLMKSTIKRLIVD